MALGGGPGGGPGGGLGGGPGGGRTSSVLLQSFCNVVCNTHVEKDQRLYFKGGLLLFLTLLVEALAVDEPSHYIVHIKR